MRVFLNRYLKKFKFALRDNNLTLRDLHAIITYNNAKLPSNLQIQQGPDGMYNSADLEGLLHNLQGLMYGYNMLKNAKSTEQQKQAEAPKQLSLFENKKRRKIFLSESQISTLQTFFAEPSKVMVVKKYLDDNFVKGNIAGIGEDGYPNSVGIVSMKGTDGNLIKNMTDVQLFYLLQDKFKNIHDDKTHRDKLLKQIIKDWYKDKISKEGLLSINKI